MASKQDTLLAIVVGLILAAGILVGARLINQTSAIQQERHDACTAQDDRHTATIKTLNRIVNQDVKRQPKRAAQIKASVPQTILLINALAPYQNCAIVAPQ